jgi:integrase
MVRRSIHSIVEVPAAIRSALFIPVMIVEPGVVPVYILGYLRNMELEGAKPATVAKAASAIGLLLDFYVLVRGRPVLDEYNLRLLVKLFYEARRYGCEELGWEAVSIKVALNDVDYISQFSSYCSVTYGHVEANPFEKVMVAEMSKGEFCEWIAKAKARKNFDLLMHAHSHTEEAQGIVKKRIIQLEKYAKKGNATDGNSVKPFPPRRVLEFIDASRSVRDKLCWLLMFYGGLRISELLHIYVRDITLDKKTGMAIVEIADPRDGVFQWHTADGRARTTTRALFLKERYRRVPRNAYPSKHPFHVGWKGMKHDDTKNKISQVYWSDPRMGQLFWKLHVQYMRSIRLHVADVHPYYFVATKDEHFGRPLQLGNLGDQFYDNAKRIGLSPQQDGVNPHGARHFYGFFSANYLRLSKERTQVMMHHASMLSTEIYYHLSTETIKRELAKAHELMIASIPDFLNSSRLLPSAA